MDDNAINRQVAIQQDMVQLVKLLSVSDFAAEELLATMQVYCKESQYRSAVDELAALVEDIEFEQAADKAKQLMASIELEAVT